MRERLYVRHQQPNALGDGVLMTALIRDIERAYPGRFEILAATNSKHVFENSPYVRQKFEKAAGPILRADVGWGAAIRLHALSDETGQPRKRHILSWYHRSFEQITKLRVPVTDPRPDLHPTEEEIEPVIDGRYWVLVAGGKWDTTVKLWRPGYAQRVVDMLAAAGITCVQVGGAGSRHTHPQLNGVIDMVGKTTTAKQLWPLIKHADGVICGVTGPMHIAAAFERPCVVYAGGREEPWFEAYTNQYDAFGPTAAPVRVEHKFLHTLGRLDCCKTHGCWASLVAPIPERQSKKQPKMCKLPVFEPGEPPIAACQDLISPEEVVRAVLDYYDEGTLPPVDGQKPALKPQKTIVAGGTSHFVVVNGTATQRSAATQPLPPVETTHAPVLHVPELDHPIIGGKVTIFVLCYGPYPELAKRCIDSILQTVPADRLDLRIGANQPAEATVEYLKTLPASRLYIHAENDFKYPVMREMLHDAEHPILTNYFLWFDDDTWVVRPDWLSDLARHIIDGHPRDIRMYGAKMFHDIKMYARGNHDPKLWFREATWYRQRQMRARSNGTPGPTGSIIDFAVGWCWAMETAAMRIADVPDKRLQHNGGDITIGEQMHQAGFRIGDWNRRKSLVACPSRADGGRRGASQRFPWATPRE